MEIIEKIGIAFVGALVMLFICLIYLVYRKTKASQIKKNKKHDHSFSCSVQGEDIMSYAPYSVIIENTTSETKQAIVFGFNRFFDKENYGSDKGVTVKPEQSNVDYCELLAQSAFEPMNLLKFRFQSQNLDQLRESVGVAVKDANGQAAYMPLKLSDYDQKSSDRNQKSILDVDYDLNIHGNAFLTINILPNTSLKIHMFQKRRKRINPRYTK